MIRFRVAKVSLLAALIGMPASLVAQIASTADNTGYGTTSAEFLLLGATARGMALGGFYSAVATDIGGLNANPAAVALMKRPGVQGSQLEWVGGSKLNWGALAMPYGGGSSAIGFQIGTFGFSDQPVYTPQQTDGTGAFYSVSEQFVAMTMARNFSDRFSVGFTAKGIFDKLGDVSGSAFAVDFGTHFHSQLAGKSVRFAFTLTNLGTELQYNGQALRHKIVRDTLPGDGDVGSLPQQAQYETSPFALPTMFRVALAYDVLSMKDAHLTLGSEFNQMRTNKAAGGGGAEFAAENIGGTPFGLALRGSWTSNPSLAYNTEPGYVKPDKDKKQGFAVGGGVNLMTKGGFLVGFDYAWKQIGQLGNATFYTFSLGW
jgi:hypothetical protein